MPSTDYVANVKDLSKTIEAINIAISKPPECKMII